MYLILEFSTNKWQGKGDDSWLVMFTKYGGKFKNLMVSKMTDINKWNWNKMNKRKEGKRTVKNWMPLISVLMYTRWVKGKGQWLC